MGSVGERCPPCASHPGSWRGACPEEEEEEGAAFLPPTRCVSFAGSAGGSAVPAAAGHGAQLPQQHRGQAAGRAGEPRVPHPLLLGKGSAAHRCRGKVPVQTRVTSIFRVAEAPQEPTKA